MSISAQISSAGNEHTFSISGHLDVSSYPDCRQVLGQGDPACRSVIDLSQAEYMDNSALGMLLLMREKVGGDTARIAIVVKNPEIKKILEVANFQRIFELKSPSNFSNDDIDKDLE
ncbi:MAG TPA: anti-sigma factor antagonist [Chromatiaceae bacterium]|nr:anti-sigma factor antagonist [Chromatiaceae bacterium]HIB83671.1 anti-sigma factor antagonist [Chromatiaceae bacterium]HIN82524.1 anti-sigma factor antagonist [Chromatiales bacterium]